MRRLLEHLVFLAFRVVRVMRVYSCEASVGASCFFLSI